MKDHRFARAVVIALVVLGLAGTATAGPATDQLKPAVDRVLAALESPALKGDSKTSQRRQVIRAITDGVFDWTEMAKRSLARHWAPRTPAEQREFVGLFRELIERAYISKIERYAGEKLVYVSESADGDQATVRTKLITKATQEVAMDYRMQRQGDAWRIYDVVIENVSLVGNYRTQFDEIIRTSSYGELVKKIKTRAS